MYKVVRRKATLEDFLKLKKTQPYKQIRIDSKSINFG